MKLQLFLSHSGACSRRRALELIKAGKVTVNGSIILEPSYQIDVVRDGVRLNKRKLFLKEKIYVLLNKPKAVTTTKKDRFAQKTVMDILPKRYSHLWPVGRLDKDTKGLLVLTNDGKLSFKLAHPRFCIDKVYIAILDKPLEEKHRRALERRVVLDDGPTSACKIIKLTDKKIKITIHEGRKRQIKRMFSLFGYKLNDLERVALGNLSLCNLPTGQWRQLTDKELLGLREIIESGS